MVSIFKGIFVDISSRTLPPYIPVGDGDARLVLVRRWEGPEVRGRCGGGGVSLVPKAGSGTLR
jgi:hypothetical protein